MFRNREFLVCLTLAAAVTAAASALCFWLDAAAGAVCLAACAAVAAMFTSLTLRRYRRVAALSAYLQNLSRGEKPLDIRDNAEGELSILKNEIYKATAALSERADALGQDKLELADALADISHQLKTPLTALGVMADLLDSDNLPADKRREFSNALRAGLGRMEWLVLTLLKLARLDAGAARLKQSRVPLSKLIDLALSPLFIPIEVKELSVSVTRTDGDTVVVCDPDWTAEALGNILKNAVENTPQGGGISVAYGENPLYAFITVRDGGPGIDKTDLPHLFKRFYRGKNASPESAGIGLAMSLAVMQKQSGDIEIANDHGAVFTLKFYK